MKIAFLYSSFFRHGGIQRVVAKVTNELAKQHDISLICTEKIDLDNNVYNINVNKINVIHADFLQNENIDRIKRIALKYNLLPIRKSSDIYFCKKMKEKIENIIDDHKFDIIIGCSMENNLLLGSIKRNTSIKLIGWEHISYDAHFSGYNMKNKYPEICKNLLGNLDRLIVLTENDKNNFSDNIKIQSTVIPNPLSFVSNKKTSLNNKKILIVGRLETNKGTDFLIDIIEGFCKLNINWNFKVIGEGEMKEFFIRKIGEKQLDDRVELLKFTEDVQSEYLKSDIYINTSRFESFGLTILEGMHHGLPIVTFNTAGPESLVNNNYSGYIIEKYNTDEFINKLNILCNNDNIRNEMSKNAITRSNDFTIEEVMEKWNQLIDGVEK